MFRGVKRARKWRGGGEEEGGQETELREKSRTEKKELERDFEIWILDIYTTHRHIYVYR